MPGEVARRSARLDLGPCRATDDVRTHSREISGFRRTRAERVLGGGGEFEADHPSVGGQPGEADLGNQRSEHVIVPAIPGGRLTDHDPATRTNTTRRGPYRHIGRPEASGNGGIEADHTATDGAVDIVGDHIDVVGNTEATDHLRQEVGPLGPSIEQREAKIGTVRRDHEPGKSAACTQVDDRSGHPRQCVDEAPSMFDGFSDRSVPQKAEALGSSQRLVQVFFGLVGAHRTSMSAEPPIGESARVV